MFFSRVVRYPKRVQKRLSPAPRVRSVLHSCLSLSSHSLLSLVQRKHKNKRTLLYTRAYKRGDTPGPTSPPPFGADEMKEQLLRVADASTVTRSSSAAAEPRCVKWSPPHLSTECRLLLRQHLSDLAAHSYWLYRTPGWNLGQLFTINGCSLNYWVNY